MRRYLRFAAACCLGAVPAAAQDYQPKEWMPYSAATNTE